LNSLPPKPGAKIKFTNKNKFKSMKKTISIFALLTMFSCFMNTSYSTTIIDASNCYITGTVYWNTDNHYIIQQSVFIDFWATLIIDVSSVGDILIEIDQGCGFEVEGSIVVIGTSSDWVTFTYSGTSGTGGWKGIEITPISSSNSFEYCIFEYILKTNVNCTGPNIAACGGIVIDQNVNTTFDNCIFQFNEVCYNGGALHVRQGGIADLNNCQFLHNYAGNRGGAISIHDGGSVTHSIENCYFYQNQAVAGGGAIWATNAKLNISHSEFEDNYCYCNDWQSNGYTGGGAICFVAGSNITNIYISSTDFITNKAENIYSSGYSFGGAIAVFAVDNDLNLGIGDCEFTSNLAIDDGGAIYLLDNNNTLHIDMVDNDFIENVAENEGGGVYFDNCDDMLDISDNLFQSNEAINGAGIFASGCEDANFHSNEFFTNKVSSKGGGIYLENCNLSTVANNNTFTENEAEYGGGCYLYQTEIQNGIKVSEFIGNSAEEDGGGIYLDESDVYVGLCKFKDNHALNGDGGGIYITGDMNDQPYKLINNLFIINTAYYNGGAIYSESDEMAMVFNCTIADNEATNGDGGGMYLVNNGPQSINTIWWGNTDYNNDYPQTYPAPAANNGFSYCCIENGPGCTGCITSDPEFVDAGNGDYRISAAGMPNYYSPCIDAGYDNVSLTENVDLKNDDRTWDWRSSGNIVIDIGAYEYEVDQSPYYKKLPNNQELYGNNDQIVCYPTLIDDYLLINISNFSYNWLKISIKNSMNQEIASVFEGNIKNQSGQFIWKPINIQSGMYFIEIRSNEGIIDVKKVFIR